LDLASSKGWVTLEEIILKTGWSTEKVQTILEDLERIGVAVRDVKYEQGLRWYFPSFASKSNLKEE
jgi:DNA-binding IclR family transcriptional regulator